MAGWNGSNGGSSAVPKKPVKAKHQLALGRGALAGVLVVAVAALAAWLLLGRGDSSTEEPGVAQKRGIVDVKPTLANVSNREVNAGDQKEAAVEVSNLNEKGRDKTDMRFAENRVAKTNEHSTVVQMAKPMFENPTEQLIADLFTTTVGDIPPIIPEIRDRDEASIIMVIDKVHKVTADDDEDAAYAKEAVNLAKRELDKFMRNGGSANEFLQYYSGELMKAHEEYQASRLFVHKSIKEGDRELTLGLLERVNKQLAEKGIKQIVLTPREKQRLGISE